MSVLTEWEMCCPNCKRDDCLQIEMTCWADLSVEGTDLDTDVCHEWDQGSECRCRAEGCGWQGNVGDANEAADAVRSEQEAQAPNETA